MSGQSLCRWVSFGNQNSKTGLLAAGGYLYGMTDGIDPMAFVFQYNPATKTFTTLHTFDGKDGDAPQGGAMVMDQSGNLYGTTEFGGSAWKKGASNGYGVVFEISTTGVYTVLYSFTGGADGAKPYGGLAIDSTGNLYGAALSGGTGYGTLYEISFQN